MVQGLRVQISQFALCMECRRNYTNDISKMVSRIPSEELSSKQAADMVPSTAA